MGYVMPSSKAVQRANRRIRYDRRHEAILKANRNQVKPFAGVDGEGGNVGVGGRHEYLLLRAGEHVLETGSPLTSQECLHFLATLPHESCIYASFFFNYDVTMILKGLPEERVKYLLDIEGRTWVDSNNRTHTNRVWWKDYGLDYLPGKEFRVCYNPDKTNKTPIKWTVINDVSGFFQCSFVSALEKWSISSEMMRNRISAEKSKRSGFAEVTNLTRLYNKKECELLSELMTEFRNVIASIGPLPTKWQGPGRLASVWLAQHNTTTIDSLPNNKRLTEVLEGANHAYYGGRFEVFAVGPIRRRVCTYDINSAYPSAMSRLPCLSHGTWRKRQHPSLDKNKDLYLAYVSFRCDSYMYGTLPIRNAAGNICYPKAGTGWYWSPELEAARAAGTSLTPHEVYVYESHCDCKPFSWVKEAYQIRQNLGKDGKQGLALKLVLNSLYGKMAQSIGRPKYANPIWAGLITSITRAQLVNATAKYEQHVLMFATDGIATDIPIPELPLSDKIGEWQYEEHESMFIVQPGLYKYPGKNAKTRGIPRWTLDTHERGLRKHYEEGKVKKGYHIELARFYGMRQAIAQGHWEQAGVWFNEDHKLSFDWRSKRDAKEGRPDFLVGTLPQPSPVRPGWRPYMLPGGQESCYYGKDIGRWTELRTWDEDQPETA